jgi:hypothetical protein
VATVVSVTAPELIVRFNVAVESHPCALPPGKFAVYVPEVVYVVPFQVYDVQAVTSVEEFPPVTTVRIALPDTVPVQLTSLTEVTVYVVFVVGDTLKV